MSECLREYIYPDSFVTWIRELPRCANGQFYQAPYEWLKYSPFQLQVAIDSATIRQAEARLLDLPIHEYYALCMKIFKRLLGEQVLPRY